MKKYWMYIVDNAFKFWIDKSSVENIWYKLRLWYYIKFDKFKTLRTYKIYSRYDLVFEDNFETFDKDLWYTSQPWGRVHPKQAFQYTSESCIDIVDSNLVLTNKYEPKEGTQWFGQKDEFDYNTTYTHGEIQLKEQYKYGIYEIRCKVPKDKNVTTAFWLSSHSSVENDIFEFFSRDDYKHGKKQKITIHWPIENELSFPLDRKMSPKNYKLPLDLTDTFRTYTLVWTTDALRFYFEGLLIRKITNKKIMKFHSTMTSLIISNGLTEDTNEKENLPESPYVIDYVKIWQK